jgi:hypothetical protein
LAAAAAAAAQSVTYRMSHGWKPVRRFALKGIELYNRTEQRRRPFSVLLCLLRSLLLLLLVGEIRKRRDILFLFSLFSWLLIERESGPEYFHVLGFNYLKRKGKE